MKSRVKSHVLSPAMEKAFDSGILNPLLEIVKRDRDLILEFRGKYAAIYCKGHRMDIRPSGKYYEISANKKAFFATPQKLQSKEDADAFVKNRLPFVRQAIAGHRSRRDEIECEQALIHANNAENLNTDYFAVDRQAHLGPGRDQIDVLGIYWPDHTLDKEVALALIEVKYALLGGVEDIVGQVERYYGLLQAGIEDVAREAQELLQQKLRLRLITGATKEALAKLARLTVSKEPKQVKIVLALVDYSPRARRLDLAKLSQLQFSLQLAHPIEVFRLGYGLWAENASCLPQAPPRQRV